jgi:polysaccharide deacetylase 2 family uncharacterized protein YibQ
MIRRPALQRPEPWPRFYLIAVVLAAVSLAAVLLLDFISARKGDPSFLFAGRGTPEAVTAEATGVKPLAEVLAASLTEAGVAESAVLRTSGPKGRPLFEVEMPAAAYPAVETALERALAAGSVRVIDRKRTTGPDRTEVLWTVRSAGREDGGISFLLPAEAKVVAAKKPAPGQVALIIDDMGNSLEALDILIALGQPVCVSVLPDSAWASQTARIAHENSLEVLLHIPLESLNGHELGGNGDGTILAAMSDGEIRFSLEAGLARVPHALGVNNHTGSRFTAERGPMRALLAPLKERGLFFVDSRTTAGSVAYGEARRMGVPAAERDVFLDADEDRGRIRGRLLELFQKAKKNGRAVGIGHPFPETLEVLRTSFGLFESYGLEVVPVSRLVR